ncbi:hypothetical protein [Mucilaginibacter lacusdianchii]|uniref:hypothetical protein n=1 Tax=Mucilaginibacter lacusdianchii TaxID=2684211 RepID=UPI00131AB11F|nr:hypothetical protein [Mucilaginibacter sp. JXJ CY 39]
MFTCKASAQKAVVKQADTASFHTICASLLTEAHLKVPPVYLLSVKDREYIISNKAINKKMVNVSWIGGIELIATSDETTDGHEVPPPTITLKLNDKEHPQAFNRLKRHLRINNL